MQHKANRYPLLSVPFYLCIKKECKKILKKIIRTDYDIFKAMTKGACKKMQKSEITVCHEYTETPEVKSMVTHIHETNELYLFISGNAKCYVEGAVYPLHPGDVMVMKRAEAHSILISSYTPYEYISVHFADGDVFGGDEILNFIHIRPLGRNNLYPNSEFEQKNWCDYFKKLRSAEIETQRKIYLSVLLLELGQSYAQIDEVTPSATDGVGEMIGYVNSHLTEDINLDTLCARFYISKAQLNRKFRQMTGSTVWQYILAKRLLLAKELLQKGERPTDVFTKCGFKDYCSFFLAFKARFDVSPKEIN